MAEYEELSGCCGARVLHELDKNPKDNVSEVKERFEGGGWNDADRCAFVVFSDRSGRGRSGPALAAFIKRHKLGTVVSTRSKKNPNSGNMITIWVWGVDAAALKRFKV